MDLETWLSNVQQETWIQQLRSLKTERDAVVALLATEKETRQAAERDYNSLATIITGTWNPEKYPQMGHVRSLYDLLKGRFDTLAKVHERELAESFELRNSIRNYNIALEGVLVRIIDAWEKDEVGQIDGGHIEEAKRVLTFKEKDFG